MWANKLYRLLARMLAGNTSGHVPAPGWWVAVHVALMFPVGNCGGSGVVVLCSAGWSGVKPNPTGPSGGPRTATEPPQPSDGCPGAQSPLRPFGPSYALTCDSPRPPP